jgi:hypothetical protein
MDHYWIGSAGYQMVVSHDLLRRLVGYLPKPLANLKLERLHGPWKPGAFMISHKDGVIQLWFGVDERRAACLHGFSRATGLRMKPGDVRWYRLVEVKK